MVAKLIVSPDTYMSPFVKQRRERVRFPSRFALLLVASFMGREAGGGETLYHYPLFVLVVWFLWFDSGFVVLFMGVYFCFVFHGCLCFFVSICFFVFHGCLCLFVFICFLWVFMFVCFVFHGFYVCLLCFVFHGVYVFAVFFMGVYVCFVLFFMSVYIYFVVVYTFVVCFCLFVSVVFLLLTCLSLHPRLNVMCVE